MEDASDQKGTINITSYKRKNNLKLGLSLQRIISPPQQQCELNNNTSLSSCDGLQKRAPPDNALSCLADLGERTNRSSGLQEMRTLWFWFNQSVSSPKHKQSISKLYFKTIFKPEKFPMDYMTFLKKAIFLMKQQEFLEIARIDVEFKAVKLDKPETIEDEYLEIPPPPPRVKPDKALKNYITVLTPAHYDYQYLPEIHVSKKSNIKFRVKAKSDAHIALSSVYGDTVDDTYEVIIGTHGNSMSLIKEGANGAVVAERATEGFLDENEYREFWISWDTRKLQVGTGDELGRNGFMVWKVPMDKVHSVNCLSVSTSIEAEGKWEFVEIIDTKDNEVDEKEVLRTKRKTAQFFLWLAKKQKIIDTLEEVYPHGLNLQQLVRVARVQLIDKQHAIKAVMELEEFGLIQQIDKGVWLRTLAPVGIDHDITISKDLSEISDHPDPTFAIITTFYCEMIAVTAILDKKATYVHHRAAGENSVYTLGAIGNANVVLTKLCKPIDSRQEATYTWNTINQLLAIFTNVKHILVVGVVGGLPHHTDFYQDVRLGDVVVCYSDDTKQPLYVNCESVQRTPGTDDFSFSTRSWGCSDQNIETSLKMLMYWNESVAFTKANWEDYLHESLGLLKDSGYNWPRPLARTDKIYMTDPAGENIQVEHPKPPKGKEYMRRKGKSRVHFGPMGSGKYISRVNELRHMFGTTAGVICYDRGIGDILDCVQDTGKDGFMIIRSVCDYLDGVTQNEWHRYSAVVAAAYCKSAISTLSIAK